MKNLEQAVIEQIGGGVYDQEVREILTDVNNHGASGGVSGFIYHNETIDFSIRIASQLCHLLKIWRMMLAILQLMK